MQARKLARAALFSSISALVALISFFVVCTWGSIVRRNSNCLCTSSRRALAAGAPMLFFAAVATILGQAWQNFPSSHKLSLTHLSLSFKLFQFKIKFAAFSHQPAGFVSFLWKFKSKEFFFKDILLLFDEVPSLVLLWHVAPTLALKVPKHYCRVRWSIKTMFENVSLFYFFSERVVSWLVGWSVGWLVF